MEASEPRASCKLTTCALEHVSPREHSQQRMGSVWAMIGKHYVLLEDGWTHEITRARVSRKFRRWPVSRPSPSRRKTLLTVVLSDIECKCAPHLQGPRPQVRREPRIRRRTQKGRQRRQWRRGQRLLPCRLEQGRVQGHRKGAKPL